MVSSQCNNSWWFPFPASLRSLLPGPNYYSNNIHHQLPLPLTHRHPDEIPHCCRGQTQSCSSELQGCHRAVLCIVAPISFGQHVPAFVSSQLRDFGGCWAAEHRGLGRGSSATAYNANLPWALRCFSSCDSLRQPQRLLSEQPLCKTLAQDQPWISPPPFTPSPITTQGGIDTDGERHQSPQGWGRRTLQHQGWGNSGEGLTPSWPACIF